MTEKGLKNSNQGEGYSGFTEMKLVELSKAGNQLAFAEIVYRHEQQIAKVIIGMLGDIQEVDDIGQEVFIRFYKSLDNFRGDSKLATYLTRIAINLSLDEIKKRSKRQIFNLNEFFTTKEEEDLVAEADECDTRELIQKVLKTLSPEYRSVVVLRLIQGYSTKETADILNIQLGTVLSRLSRAQKKLKTLLKAHL